MKLKDWFDYEEERTGKRPKKVDVAKKCNVSAPGFQRWIDGTIPAPRYIPLIEKATGGKVKLADFYSTPKTEGAST